MAAEPDSEIDYGVSDGVESTSSGNQIIDGILGGGQWVDRDLTFSFPDDRYDFDGSNLGPYDSLWRDSVEGFIPFDGVQAEQIRDILELFENVSGLTFTELDGPEGALDEDQETEIRFAQTEINDVLAPRLQRRHAADQPLNGWRNRGHIDGNVAQLLNCVRHRFAHRQKRIEQVELTGR